LAVYPSDSGGGATTSATGRPTQKRGGFGDLLHLYTQRLLSILKDEQEDKRSMIRWLERSYGREATNSIQASELDKLAPEEQMSRLRDFLQWFRGEFPYYYDRCSQCGASVREDVANNNEEQEHSDAADGDEKGHKTFLGYVYPAKTELKGKASRTELYKCHECSHYTRFPRYNAAWHVMEHQRGRCGEYSMLVFRMLRALAYETRWVVDWADHVWVEVWLPRASQWVHLDPCEAAVDEKL
jgi:DNA-directed RNA polymerase subunit RPC12/RpoP